jgi:uncharacterized protein (TIGR00661 family)
VPNDGLSAQAVLENYQVATLAAEQVAWEVDVKVLVGVCGIGYGHSLRQASVVQELRKRGHFVAAFGFLCSTTFFRERFSTIPFFEIRRPWLPPTTSGLDFAAAAHDARNSYSDGHAVNFAAFDSIISLFGGAPDLVISDYCPVAAQLAYATCAPLVTIDNQSKFMGFTFPPTAGRTRDQERCRLNLFFPHADLRISTSFFKVTYDKDPKYSVEIVPPLIRSELLTTTPEEAGDGSEEVIVYLSSHPAIKEGENKSVRSIVTTLQKFATSRFRIYVNSPECGTVGNVKLQTFDAASFPDHLRKAKAIISNAGDGIISEAIHLEKPILTIPLSSYEQAYNASVVSRIGLGRSQDNFSEEAVATFLANLEYFREKLKKAKNNGMLQPGDGLQSVMSRLESQFRI